MSVKLSVVAIALVLAMSSGCATLFAAGPDRFPVNTNPPGAYVYVNGQMVGQTPTVVSLNREHSAQIQIYLPGFQPVVMIREKGLNGWFFANILWVYAVVPVIIDLVTGNWQCFDDDPIAIGLVPNGGAPAPNWYQQPQGYPPSQQQPYPSQSQPYPAQPQPYPAQQPYPPQPQPAQGGAQPYPTAPPPPQPR